ncbi:MAG TPA: hypothetical protein VF255_11850 [Solirubrobacterales bacterium]
MGSGRADRRQPRRRARPGFLATHPLAAKIEAVHRSLDEAGVPHAFGGALALAFYAEPRETKDIDVNVFMSVKRWPKARDALVPLGVDIEIDEVDLETKAQVKLGWEESPLHLFFSQDALHKEMELKIRNVSYEGLTIPLVAPEHLVIRKALLDRTKDWLDIERILLATSPIDLGEIESWMEQMVGVDDPRLAKLVAASLGAFGEFGPL